MIICIYIKSCFVEYRKLLLLFLKVKFFYDSSPPVPLKKKYGFSDSILIKIALQRYIRVSLFALLKKQKNTNLFAGLSQISAEVESLEAPLAPPFIL